MCFYNVKDFTHTGPTSLSAYASLFIFFLADVFLRDKITDQTQKSGSHQVASGLHLGHFAVAAYEEMRKMQTPHFLQGCDVAEWSCKFDVPVCTMIKEFVQQKKKRNHKKHQIRWRPVSSLGLFSEFSSFLLCLIATGHVFFFVFAYSSTTATPKEGCART